MPATLQLSYPSILALGGKTWPIGRYVSSDTNWSACNPSIGYSPELGYAMTIRSSNYLIDDVTGNLKVQGDYFDIKSRVWFCELSKDLKGKNMREVKFADSDLPIKRGIEDAKLFWRDGSWYFTGVMKEEEHTPLFRMAIFRFDHKTSTAYLVKKFEGPDVTKPEKNWMLPYEENPNFDFIYGPTSIIKGNYIISKMNVNEDIGTIRGNTNLWKMPDNTYVSIVHSLYLKMTKMVSHIKTDRTYTHQFTRYNEKGDIIGISEEFVFQKMQVEFAAGLVVKGDEFIITYGVEDASSHFASIPIKNVLKMIKPINND
jgi:predicted GH43/DUF377 family glycosyl hydrolase